MDLYVGLTARRDLEFPSKSRRRHVHLRCNLIWDGIWSDVKRERKKNRSVSHRCVCLGINNYMCVSKLTRSPFPPTKTAVRTETSDEGKALWEKESALMHLVRINQHITQTFCNQVFEMFGLSSRKIRLRIGHMQLNS